MKIILKNKDVHLIPRNKTNVRHWIRGDIVSFSNAMQKYSSLAGIITKQKKIKYIST